MRKRKTIQDRLKEIKQEQEKEEQPEPKQKKKPQGYKVEDLEKFLFEDNNVIKDFKEVEKDIKDKTLMISTITEEVSDMYGLPKGQYIGLAKEPIRDLEAYSNLYGKMPRDLYERCRTINILMYTDNDNPDYQQKDLIQDIKDNRTFKDVRQDVEELGFTPISSEKIDYLSLLDKSDIDNKIEEVLKRYDDLHEPNERLRYYIKLRDLMGTESQIIYCDILDKGVLILD